MSGHRGYVFNCARVVKAMRKSGMVKHNKKDASPKTLFKHLSLIYKLKPEIKSTMECMIHAEEHYWMNNGQQIYFFEDAQFCRNIMKGSYSIKETLPLYHSNESFILMQPDDFELAGYKGSGLLVTIFKHKERDDELFNDFFKAVDGGTVNVQMVGETGVYTVCVAYQEKGGADVYSRLALPNHWIEHVCKMETAEQYVEFMRERNKFDYFEGALLDSQEMNYQFQVMRLVVGFLVYRHALPQRIRDGLPNGVSRHEFTSPTIPKPHTAIVSHPAKERGEVTGHYRSWHFRQLTDDRYYRGEHEGQEKGSRIVFVSDSFVAKGDAHISTVES